MANIKCEMCGGSLVVEDNGAFAICEYCGTRIPIGNANSPDGSADPQTQNNYAQINALRIENEKRRMAEANAQAEKARLNAESQRLEYERLSEKNRIEKNVREKKAGKKLLAIFLTFASIIALGILTVTVIIPGAKYSSAEKALKAEEYEEAYTTFKSISKYKDSQARAQEIIKAHPSVAQVGDVIYFGNYEQDNNISNGKEEIEWIVLEKDENGKMLVVSKYALDCRFYHSSAKKVTWENCDLRAWLNKDFMSTAFTASEKSNIKVTTVENTGNSEHKVEGSNSTKDYVFLLSIEESKRYFPKTVDRICKSTAYAESLGSDFDGITDYCRWWLRSPGSSLYNAASVKVDGFVLNMGSPVSVDKAFIRPAMWVEFE